MFANGLGISPGKIERLVTFIGNDGGVAGRPAALSLAPDIAREIFENRGQFDRSTSSASPILTKGCGSERDRNSLSSVCMASR